MKTETVQKWLKRAMAVVYVVLMAVTFYPTGMLTKIASMVVIPMGMLYLMVYADFENIKKVWRVYIVWIAYLAILICISLGIWIINIEQTMYIKAGLVKIFYQVINSTVMLFAVYLFRENTVDYTLYGAALMNSIVILQALQKWGLSASISSIFEFLSKLDDQTGFMRDIEIHDLTYVYAIALFYYVLVSKRSKWHRIAHGAMATFFFLSGFKRIGIAAAVLALCIAYYIKKRPTEKALNKSVTRLGIIAVVACMLYIPIVREGVFERIMNAGGIATNSRTNVYNYVRQIYTFGPNFIGYGFDYVTRFLAELKRLHIRMNGSSLLKLHNDLLVQYIELGFFGYLYWLIFNNLFFLKWWKKNFGKKAMLLYCACNIYIMIACATDNTAYSYPIVVMLKIATATAVFAEDDPPALSPLSQ